MGIKKNKKRKKASVARGFLSVLNGDFLNRKNALSSLPYVLFVTMLLLGYIGNTHYAEATVDVQKPAVRDCQISS